MNKENTKLNILFVIKYHILKTVQEKLSFEKDFQFQLEEPPKHVPYDLCSNVVIVCSKLLSEKYKLPKIAEILVQSLTSYEAFDSVSMLGGYINFKLNLSFTSRYLQWQKISDASRAKQRIQIEFVSANPTGPLHVGHGRGAVLGDSLAKIYKFLGYNVHTEYYINDLGTQMEHLAQSVKKRFEAIQNPKNSCSSSDEIVYEGDYIKDIARLMIQKNRTDFEEFPKKFILQWIKKDLDFFRIHFDTWFSEKTLHQQNKLEEMILMLKKNGCVVEKDHAIWFKTYNSCEKINQDKERVLRRSNGKYTYFTADLAYHDQKYRQEYDKMINIWGHDHHGYAARLNNALISIKHDPEKLKIILYQLVSLKRGEENISMSTRKGEFVTLRQVLDEVGVDAGRFFFATKSPHSQLDFDFEITKKKNKENPIHYIQYAHARIISLLKKMNQHSILEQEIDQEKIHWNIEEISQYDRDLIIKLSFFYSILENCIANNSLHFLTNYLMKIAILFHRFYDHCPIASSGKTIQSLRLVLLKVTQKIIYIGTSLIGVQAVEKM